MGYVLLPSWSRISLSFSLGPPINFMIIATNACMFCCYGCVCYIVYIFIKIMKFYLFRCWLFYSFSFYKLRVFYVMIIFCTLWPYVLGVFVTNCAIILPPLSFFIKNYFLNFSCKWWSLSSSFIINLCVKPLFNIACNISIKIFWLY